MGSTRRRVSGLAILAAASLGITSCDDSDGDGTTGPNALIVTSIEPPLLVAYQAAPFTLRGTGFDRAVGGPVDITSGVVRATNNQVVVTFRTDDGTPFGDGTASEAQVTGTVISDTEIQGTTPLTNASGLWLSSIAVTDALGEASSATELAVFGGLTVFDIDREVVRGDLATPFEVFGLTFQPPSGTATVRFTAVSPASFPGGASTLDVPGTIVDALHITGTTPILALGAPVPAFVTVILDQPGNPTASSSNALLVFAPPPTPPISIGTITSPLPLAVASPFTITGSGFLPPGSGPAVEVMFVAANGTPFLGGTAAVVRVSGTASNDTTIDGVSPTGGSLADVNAIAIVTRADGISATSSTTTLFTAPVATVDSFAPSEVPANAATPFTISGTNLPASGTATVRFRAVAGTPFTGGTVDRVDVTANAASTQITGATPLATTTGSFLAEITVILTGGTELPMGDVCLFVPGATPPNPSIVTNLNDSGAGSLRNAIVVTPQGTPITFDPALAGTINVQSTLLVSSSVHVVGPGADVIEVSAGNGDYPVFTIAAATTSIVEKLTISDSRHTGDGGGLLVNGSVTLTRCDVIDNSIGGKGGGVFVGAGASVALNECSLANNASGGRGGGVFVESGGSVTVTGCTFADNTSGAGGGALATHPFGTATVVNGTFNGNDSTGGPDGGGAIYVAPNSTVSLTHCTIAKNVAYNRGGGVYVGGTLVARNCVFARDADGKKDTEIANANGTVDVQFSLVRVGTGSGLVNGVNGNRVGTPEAPVDAKLGLLEANGGPTRTMALQPTSPALDSGTAATGTSKDQRGIDRPQGAAPDMGAYESTVPL